MTMTKANWNKEPDGYNDWLSREDRYDNWMNRKDFHAYWDTLTADQQSWVSIAAMWAGQIAGCEVSKEWIINETEIPSREDDISGKGPGLTYNQKRRRKNK
tara:strand:+ start:311 stop:613 length:303 start_codon:yes stop_codon:yes gene_type:complete